jgi:hypothetical protein
MNQRSNFLLYTLILLGCHLTNAQEDNEGFALNAATNLTAAASNNVQSHGSSGYFYNPKRTVDGTEYLFDDWDNSAVIYTKDNYTYTIKNINLNIKSNLFLSKLSKDSIFTFNMNSIDRIVIDSKIYKNIYSEKGRTICEVIFESEQFSILKGFHLQSVEGSPNPMINRTTDKIIRKKRYYVLKDDSLDTFRFAKRKILALVDLEKVTFVKEYVKLNDLSFRKEEDVKQILEYNSSL